MTLIQREFDEISYKRIGFGNEISNDDKKI